MKADLVVVSSIEIGAEALPHLQAFFANEKPHQVFIANLPVGDTSGLYCWDPYNHNHGDHRLALGGKINGAVQFELDQAELASLKDFMRKHPAPLVIERCIDNSYSPPHELLYVRPASDVSGVGRTRLDNEDTLLPRATPSDLLVYGEDQPD